MNTKRLGAIILAIALLILSQGQNAKAQSGWTYLHTSGKNILDANNNIVHISGVNWFGAETPDYAPDGLWSRSYKDMLNQIKSLGYNTIRLPFSTDFLDFKDTGGGYTPNLSLWANPELADPANPSAAIKGVPLLDKLIAYAGSIGLRVFLDRHRADASHQSPLWYIPGSSKYTEARWINDWVWLANHYANNPTVIGADLHNEPHSVQGDPTQSACWGCGNTARDWKLASQRAGNAIIAANPGWLIIVEGTDTNPVTGAGTWWGGDLSNVGNDPVVLNSPGHVVYSPHEYPASLFAQSWFSDPTYPNNMPAVWESHWGYLDTNNIAPVLIGEFGSRLTTTSDQQWLNALAIGAPGTGYIRSKSLHWTFWSWNPNSGDTGGILNDDWTTVIQAKQSILSQIQYPLIGSQTNNPTPTRTSTPTATNTQATFQPATNTSTATATATRTNTPTITPSGTGGVGIDLIISNIAYAGSIVACQNQPGVNVTVTNRGTVNAGAFNVRVNNSVTQAVSSLAAGASTTIRFNLFGGTITAVADADNAIAESNESNNSLTANVPVPTQGPTCTPTRTPTSTVTATPTATVGTPPASSLKVQYRNADNSPADNQIKPHFQIVNSGSTSVALNMLKIRYWYTGEAGASTYNAWCDYAVISCSSITFAVVTVSPARSGADHYLEVSFNSGNVAAGGNTGEMQIRLNKTDWSNFDETNDYSRGTATSFADWSKVTLYQNGALVWGTEP